MIDPAREASSNVAPITTDPLVRIRAALANGREEFWEAVRRLPAAPVAERTPDSQLPSNVVPLFRPARMQIAQTQRAFSQLEIIEAREIELKACRARLEALKSTKDGGQ